MDQALALMSASKPQRAIAGTIHHARVRTCARAHTHTHELCPRRKRCTHHTTNAPHLRHAQPMHRRQLQATTTSPRTPRAHSGTAARCWRIPRHPADLQPHPASQCSERSRNVQGQATARARLLVVGNQCTSHSRSQCWQPAPASQQRRQKAAPLVFAVAAVLMPPSWATGSRSCCGCLAHLTQAATGLITKPAAAHGCTHWASCLACSRPASQAQVTGERLHC